ALIGCLVWLFMKASGDREQEQMEKITLAEVKEVLRLPSVWLLMVIVLCAYVAYKITDVISLYAEQVMLYDQVEAAKTGTLLQFLRPTTGILMGLVADRFKITWLLFLAFVATLLGGILFGLGIIAPNTTVLFFMSVSVVAIGVYSCRALYFGAMQVGKIPLVLTGTAVGLISLIGYTPDIFAGPAYGYLLDTFPGETGHRYVFWMLSGFALVGGIASYVYYVKYGRGVGKDMAS
ncbi:MAG: MFS transporter, partial [Flavobacteriaceae bacterium]